MSCLSWNCCGMAALATVSELQNLCKQFKPAIVFLIETRAKREYLEKIKRKFCFDGSFCVEPRRLSGARPAISSDHCPIILVSEPKNKCAKEFKYEAFWEDHEECANTTKKRWNRRTNKGQRWGKTFTRADKEIAKLSDKFQKLQASGLSEEQHEQIIVAKMADGQWKEHKSVR
ncbi:hypothetical protein Ahy_B04g069438 [Arachis hypogaea]|uniref:Endonuclease/exonuclease/phosphatase domain-containing protein n=1 Tax=Arachis hypogaea TaxID=3818 RepID=A0A444ZCN7_ARAHY|nr:hypothetical protein Ahy_B04g069438 [Arachis hypogaea]